MYFCMQTTENVHCKTVTHIKHFYFHDLRVFTLVQSLAFQYLDYVFYSLSQNIHAEHLDDF